MSADVSDCIAMSEDGDWYAYPKTMKRGQVMSATARQLEYIGYGDWRWVLQHYTVRAGYVRKRDDSPPQGWREECEAHDDGAVPCWIVRSRS